MEIGSLTLEEYQLKRDFEQSPEPMEHAGTVAAIVGLRFVVQKNDSRNLHFDFRLEHDGVLQSWAVPPGPRVDPSVKRLAVEVEDHPLSYADFAGDIPAGHYHAGRVLVWDTGIWQPHRGLEEMLRRES